MSPSGAKYTRRSRCEKAQSSRPIAHSEHRAVSQSYRARWLGLIQALHRPHSTLTAKERPLAGSPARAAGKGLGGVCERAWLDCIQRKQAPCSSAVLFYALVRCKTSFTASRSDRHSQRTTLWSMRVPKECRSVPAPSLASFTTDFSDSNCQAAVTVLHRAENASIYRRDAEYEHERVLLPQLL